MLTMEQREDNPKARIGAVAALLLVLLGLGLVIWLQRAQGSIFAPRQIATSNPNQAAHPVAQTLFLPASPPPLLRRVYIHPQRISTILATGNWTILEVSGDQRKWYVRAAPSEILSMIRNGEEVMCVYPAELESASSIQARNTWAKRAQAWRRWTLGLTSGPIPSLQVAKVALFECIRFVPSSADTFVVLDSEGEIVDQSRVSGSD